MSSVSHALVVFVAPIVVFDLVRLFALVVFLLSRMSHRLSLVLAERFTRYHFVVVYLWSGSSAIMCIRGAAHPLSFCCCVSVERLIRYLVYPWSGLYVV
jgi:hypothetical protein